MKLIVGLGNPGDKYGKTRHNVGFMVMEALAKSMGFEKWELSKKYNSLIANYSDSQPTTHNSQPILAKPQTFMNDSGVAVSALASYFKINNSDLFVIHDDLDIRLGEYKIQNGTGPKVHNGVNSIEEKLGSNDFWRVRVGIDNRIAARSEGLFVGRGEEYVLQKFSDDEFRVLDSVIKNILTDLIDLTSKH